MDIVVSSAKAYVAGLNKMAAWQRAQQQALMAGGRTMRAAPAAAAPVQPPAAPAGGQEDAGREGGDGDRPASRSGRGNLVGV